jgi:hypothetical protein
MINLYEVKINNKNKIIKNRIPNLSCLETPGVCQGFYLNSFRRCEYGR